MPRIVELFLFYFDPDELVLDLLPLSSHFLHTSELFLKQLGFVQFFFFKGLIYPNNLGLLL